MVEPTRTYEVVLRRDDIAEYIRHNFSNFRRAFGSLDDVAGQVRDHDDYLTEVLHSLADILRGVLAERYGVDFRPTSDLGPDDAVDLPHALRVLADLLDNLQGEIIQGEIAAYPQDQVVPTHKGRLAGPNDAAT